MPLRAFTDTDFAAVLALAQHAAGDHPVDATRLRAELEALLSATGHAKGDDFTRAFQEAAAAKLTPHEMADAWTAFANDRPYSLIDFKEAQRHILHQQLSATLARACTRVGIAADTVELRLEVDALHLHASPDGRARLKPRLAQLAIAARKQNKQGAPSKYDQDFLLLQLADIYLSAIGSSAGSGSLMPGTRALFIRFAHAALTPFFSASEVSLEALTRRWQRLREREGWVARPL